VPHRASLGHAVLGAAGASRVTSRRTERCSGAREAQGGKPPWRDSSWNSPSCRAARAHPAAPNQNAVFCAPAWRTPAAARARVFASISSRRPHMWRCRFRRYALSARCVDASKGTARGAIGNGVCSSATHRRRGEPRRFQACHPGARCQPSAARGLIAARDVSRGENHVVPPAPTALVVPTSDPAHPDAPAVGAWHAVLSSLRWS
jgi:hypothetical protein